MPSKAIYTRLQTELYEKVKTHAGATGQSISSAVEDLVQRGVEELASEGLETLEKQVAELTGALEACRAKESIAMAAQSHSVALQKEAEDQKQKIEELQNYLLTPVAKCRNCATKLRLFDIGQQKCAYCGKWDLGWLPEYTVPTTKWEVVRNGAAAVGAVVVVVALLNALAGGQQRS